MNYNVEILEQKFEREDGTTFDKTVRVTFIDKDGKDTEKEYGYVKEEDVYNLIENGEEINLKGCYLKSFSLETYRKSKKLNTNDYVELRNFSAEDAFIDGNVCFSYSVFVGGGVNFKKTRFGGGTVDFESTIFGDRYVDFSAAFFPDCSRGSTNSHANSLSARFNYAVFGKGDLIFNGTQFGKNSMVSFLGVRFGNSRLDFRGVSGSNIDLSLCDFNNFLDLRGINCDYLNLSHTIVRDIIDLRYFSPIVPTKIKEINIYSMRNLGKIYIDWELNNVKNLIIRQKETTSREKAYSSGL